MTTENIIALVGLLFISVTNIGGLIGIYVQMVQRLTRVETKQEHINQTFMLMAERRMKERN